MKDYLFAFLFFILLGGCSSNLNISGKYGSNGNANVFQLKKDLTFIYEYRAYHFYEYSTGTWRELNNRMVILNSHFRSIRIPIKCEETQDKKLGDENVLNVNLRIKNGLNLSNYICEVIINDSTHFVKRCDSLFNFLISSKIKKMTFKFSKEPIPIISNRIIAPLTTDVFFTKFELSGNFHFHFDIDDAWFAYRPFVGEVVKIGKNDLKLFNTYSDRWEKISKLPDTADIFFDFVNTQK